MAKGPQSNGTVAVVTGGASGIGLCIARVLAERGMSVVAADWSSEACAGAEKTLAEYGSGVVVVRVDIGTEDGAKRAIDSAIDHFGGLDVLCNNAAIHPHVLVEEMDPATWSDTFRVNVFGAFLCSKLAIPHMKRRGQGIIVNIGSISGHAPYAGGSAYAASKAALATLTRALALEVGAYGITVNCISPGAIRIRDVSDSRQGQTHIPVGRSGTPEEVASLVLYLASEQARYMTGANLILDGGATAGRQRPQAVQREREP